MIENRKAISVLVANTFGFVLCFACWVLYGVLITFLVDNGVYKWDSTQVGWLLGVPILTGSIMRLPVGVLTDRYGGRNVFVSIMLLAATAVYCVSLCNRFEEFLLAGLGFGIAGAAFAVGIAYTSLWFPKEKQGTALGIFGAGNAGAAITSFGAPLLLNTITNQGQNLEAWRQLPQIYAMALVGMTILFWLMTSPRKPERQGLTIQEQLAPLKDIRVWRFGLYYFFVFGGFVALAQWLVPYYLNVYGMTLATAGMMAAIFSLPSGVIRAAGGWMSDKWGARAIMYLVLVSCLICVVALCIPRMDIQTPGEGIMAAKKGVVTKVTAEQITVDGKTYQLQAKDESRYLTISAPSEDALVWPTFVAWQEPVVKVGEPVVKKQLLARGITHIFFQANVWIFTFLVLVLGVMTGIGKAAVYKYIPDYFPQDVAVVGGIVGVIGGLGGFVGPIMFGYALKATGLWTSCWMFLTILCAACLIWMHVTITRMMNKRAPVLMQKIDTEAASLPEPRSHSSACVRDSGSRPIETNF